MTGVPTVLITVEPEQSRMARPPRALWPVDYGLGNPLGMPEDAEVQKRIIREALDLVVNPSEPGRTYELKL